MNNCDMMDCKEEAKLHYYGVRTPIRQWCKSHMLEMMEAMVGNKEDFLKSNPEYKELEEADING